MSNWHFDELGKFDSEDAAHRWAQRNNLDPRDIKVTRSGNGARLDVRRSALGDNKHHHDLRDGRRSGW